MTVAEKLTRAKADYDEVYEAGKKAEYDRFWDAYQNNGNRFEYYFAFAGIGWTDENFKPKYDIGMKYSASQAFMYCKVTDLVKTLKACGVVLDVSRATTLASVFAYAETKTIPTLNTTGANAITSMFESCTKLEYIEKLIVKKATQYSYTFKNCPLLKDVVFEGEIGNDINFQWSTLLSKASIESIVGCLSDTATGKTLTLSRAAVESAFPEGSTAKQEVKLYPFTFGLASLEAQGYTVTDNGDGSVTVDGGAEGTSGYIEFFGGSLPAGTYEVSYREEGTGVTWGMTVLHNDNAFPVNSGEAIQMNVENDDTVAFSVDLMGAYSNRKMTVTLRKLVTWDALVASKPNWTISLV
jgi:hypothetical protein